MKWALKAFMIPLGLLMLLFVCLEWSPVRAQVPAPPPSKGEIELVQTSQYTVALVANLENFLFAPQQVRMVSTNQLSSTYSLQWNVIPGTQKIRAVFLVGGNVHQILVSSSLTPTVGLFSAAWQPLGMTGWARPWPEIVSVTGVPQPLKLTLGEVVTLAITLRNGGMVTGTNMPINVVHSTAAQRLTGWPWVSQYPFIPPAEAGSFVGTVSYFPLLSPGEVATRTLTLRASEAISPLVVYVCSTPSTESGMAWVDSPCAGGVFRGEALGKLYLPEVNR